MRRLAAALVLAALLPLAAHAEPVPPRPTGHVNDLAGVMGEWKAKTEALAAQIEKETSFEVAVLAVNTLDGEQPQPYAQKVYDVWGIGKKGKDNGILLLVAVKDRKIWIATGYGAEKIIPDGRAGQIRDRQLAPAFKRGEFGKGLHDGVAEVGRIVRAAAKANEPAAVPTPVSKNEIPDATTLALGFAIVLLPGALLLHARNRRAAKRRAQEAEERRQALAREEAAALRRTILSDDEARAARLRRASGGTAAAAAAALAEAERSRRAATTGTRNADARTTRRRDDEDEERRRRADDDRRRREREEREENEERDRRSALSESVTHHDDDSGGFGGFGGGSSGGGGAGGDF